MTNHRHLLFAPHHISVVLLSGLLTSGLWASPRSDSPAGCERGMTKRARDFRGSRKFDEALKTYKVVIESCQHSLDAIEARMGSGDIYFAQQKSKQAIREYEAILESLPAKDKSKYRYINQARKGIVLSYFQMGEYGKAESFFIDNLSKYEYSARFVQHEEKRFGTLKMKWQSDEKEKARIRALLQAHNRAIESKDFSTLAQHFTSDISDERVKALKSYSAEFPEEKRALGPMEILIQGNFAKVEGDILLTDPKQGAKKKRSLHLRLMKENDEWRIRN